MKSFIKEYLIENIKVISIIFLCIIIGLVIGLFLYKATTPQIRNDFISTMKNTLDLTKQENFEGINIIKNGMVSNIFLVLIIYIISLTLVAPYLTGLLSMFKGISIGIYIPTLFQIFGTSKGILAVLLLVIIPNLVYIPSYIFLCTNSINFHYMLLNSENKFSLFIKEIVKIILGFSIMFIGVILEQLTSYWIIRIYSTIY